jgi:4-amino-4-deoxychorismate lyase
MNDKEIICLLKKHNQFIQTSNLPNRASFFGDGIFETFVYENNQIKFGEYHYERALKGCEVLGLEKSMLTPLSVLEDLLNLKIKNKSMRVRWNIYRGGLGKYTPEENFVVENFLIQPFIRASEFKTKAFFSDRITVPSLPWSNCKTLSALIYVMAGQEKVQKGFDEVILLNAHGHVCEAGSSNLFWIKDEVYYTPALSTNCVAGIGRRVVIEELKSMNLPIYEGEFNTVDVLNADHVFTTNVTGISSILKIEDKAYKPVKNQNLLDLF